jgi:hypothetical protein
VKSLLPSCCRGILPAVLLPALSTSIQARPEFRDGFFYGYRDNGYLIQDYMLTPPSHPGGSDKMDCLLCHWDPKGGGPRNPHGVRVQDVIEGIDEKDTAALGAAMWGIRNEDPEGDTYSTFIEVTDHLPNGGQDYTNTPTFPGLSAANVGSVKMDDLEPADIDFLYAKLVPEGTTPDTTPPVLAVIHPNGGESLTAHGTTTIQWTVSDGESGVAGVDIYLSLDNGATFAPLAYLAGSAATDGSFTWLPANRPSAQAVIQLYAIDNAGNPAADESDAVFAIDSPPGGLVQTTLRDFDMPGTQPLENRIQPLQDPETCSSCHGGYDTAAEPHHNWQGSMMAMASRDFLFEANMVIANQDAPESGDLCLRCHNSRGWLDGRSSPTDGSLMTTEDHIGVSCDLCHRMVDPQYDAGVDPAEDAEILAGLGAAPSEHTTGSFVVDPSGSRRGPFDDAASAHPVLVSPFHRSANLCGTCHDVSNPAFVRPPGAVSGDEYDVHPLDQAAADMSSTVTMPVERTYSEWLHSAFNSLEGVPRPEFAGNRADGRVASCQDCHMRDVAGMGCDPGQFPAAPLRADLPLHDMTGSSTWVPLVLTNLYPAVLDPAAVADGVARARYMLRNALHMQITDDGARMRVRLINRTGHKLPTGYPEGRRMWINVQFFDASSVPLKESGAYDELTGVLDLADPEIKVYETKPGIGTNLAAIINGSLPPTDPDYIHPGPSFHFVLNNRIYKDNRIPPEGYTHAGYDAFGGAPVGHTYADGQSWDDTWYEIPFGADRAEVRVYFQSVSKEFVEFLRDENDTNTLGDEVYSLWVANDKAPPELMKASSWYSGFVLTDVASVGGEVHITFASQVGRVYRIEYAERLDSTPLLAWTPFQNAGTLTATSATSSFVDDFTTATSGAPSSRDGRYYRVSY